VAPFGWVLGGPGPTERSFELGQAHSSAALDTWSVHCFDPGHHGQTEVCALHAPFMHGEPRQDTAMRSVRWLGRVRWLGLSISLHCLGSLSRAPGFLAFVMILCVLEHMRSRIASWRSMRDGTLHCTVQMQWAHMRNASLRLETLKVHQMSEHAIVPIVGGDIVVVVAPTLKVRHALRSFLPMPAGLQLTAFHGRSSLCPTGRHGAQHSQGEGIPCAAWNGHLPETRHLAHGLCLG
jgi:hypothetical protein